MAAIDTRAHATADLRAQAIVAEATAAHSEISKRLDQIERVASETAVLARIAAASIGDAAPYQAPVQGLSAPEDAFVLEVKQLSLTQAKTVSLVNSWIFSSIAPGSTEGRHPLVSLQGECGDREFAFSRIAMGLGIPTRRISFFTVPIQLSHVGVEAFHNGKWRFFDPTAGLYFSYAGDSEPIGIAEARAAYPSITVWKSDREPWTGVRQALSDEPYEIISNNILIIKGAPVIDVERTYFASEMTGASEENILFNSVSLSSANEPRTSIGFINGSPADVAATSIYGPLREYLGRVGNTATGMRFWFRTNETRRARIIVRLVSKKGRILADLNHRKVIYGLDETLIQRDETETAMTLTFPVFAPASSLSLWGLGKNGAVIDAYEAEFLSE